MSFHNMEEKWHHRVTLHTKNLTNNLNANLYHTLKEIQEHRSAQFSNLRKQTMRTIYDKMVWQHGISFKFHELSSTELTVLTQKTIGKAKFAGSLILFSAAVIGKKFINPCSLWWLSAIVNKPRASSKNILHTTHHWLKKILQRSKKVPKTAKAKLSISSLQWKDGACKC